MTAVKSSSIAEVHHVPATNTLKVTFHSGETYHYAGVSAADHSRLMSAPSIGSHFQKNIRGTFKGTKQ